MTQHAKGQEPSMEEILASIRRIIADDDPARPSQKETAPQEASLKPDESVAPPRSPLVRAPPPQGSASSPLPGVEELDSMLAQLRASRPAPAPETDSDILDLT